MKLIKSILLGSATGFVAMTGAQAADLPSRKAAPVEYVRACSAAGVGFFYIPGTETCLKVGGRVRAEYYYTQTFNRGQDNSGFRGLGRLELDARTQTAYGTLRTFVRLEVAKRSGNGPFNGHSGTQMRYGNAIGSQYTYIASNASVLGSGLGGRIQTDVQIDKAFIQWAGITAGRFASFFDFYANDLTWMGTTGSSVGATNGFAYTATFGSGFSATLAVEDPFERRMGVIDATSFGVPNPYVIVPGGNAIPDLVANIRLDQAWGSAQLSGALHEVRPGFSGGYSNTAFVGDTEYGFAIQAGVKFNMPFIAPGDVLWLQAAYANGATSYAGAGAFLGSGNPVQSFGGFSNIAMSDAVAVDTYGPYADVKLVKSYGVTGGFLHYWTPTVRQGVFGSYLKVDVPTRASIYNTINGANIGLPDWSQWMVGSNLIWSPVRDLDLGVEVMYTRVDPKGRVLDANRVGRTISSEDVLGGRVRIQRTF